MTQYTDAQIKAYMDHLAQSGKYKPEDISAYEGHLQENYGPRRAGISPDNSKETDLFQNPGKSEVGQSDTDRMAASFGNLPGVKAQLMAKGYKDVKETPDGYAALGPDGVWYKDANNFFPKSAKTPVTDLSSAAKAAMEMMGSAHPINWTESHLGHALPLMGMAAGGTGGGTAAGPLGAVAGATAVGALGEQARRTAGAYLGTYKGDPTSPEELSSLGAKGLEMGATEMGGQLVNKVPVPLGNGQWSNVGKSIQTGFDTAGDYAKGLLSRTSGAMTRMDPDFSRRVLDRPSQVLNASGEDFTLDTAKKAQQEYLEGRDRLGKNVESARNSGLDQYGNEMADTSSVLDNGAKMREEMAPNAEGVGKLSPQEMGDLSSFERRTMTSPEFSTNPLPGNRGYRLVIDDQPVTLSPGKYSEKLNYGQPQEQKFSLNPYQDSTMQMIPIERQKIQTSPPVQVHPTLGVENDMPEKSFKSLQPTADYLAREIDNHFDQNSAKTRSDPYVNNLQKYYGQIKQLFHARDPNRASADAAYNEFKNAGKLVPGINNTGQQQGVIKNIGNDTKSAQLDALRTVAPNTTNTAVDDYVANRAFGDKGPSLGPLSTARALRLALGGGMGYAASNLSSSHSPLTGLEIAASFAAATDPAVHKLGLFLLGKAGQLGGQGVDALAPQLPALTMPKMNPWSLKGDSR